MEAFCNTAGDKCAQILSGITVQPQEGEKCDFTSGFNGRVETASAPH